MYTNIRKKLNKFADGGKIPKLSRGARIQLLISQGYTQLQAERIYDLITGWQLGDDDDFYDSSENTLLGSSAWDQFGQGGYYHAATLNMLKDGYNGTFTNDLHKARNSYINTLIANEISNELSTQLSGTLNATATLQNSTELLQSLKSTPIRFTSNSNFATMTPDGKLNVNLQTLDSALLSVKNDLDQDVVKQGIGEAFGNVATLLATQAASAIGGQSAGQGVSMAAGSIKDMVSNGFSKESMGNLAAGAGVAAVNMVDKMAMGDKNFGAQSEAIDGAVHGVSGALMNSGNPYAMIAGAALEGVNFLTKAGGLTVQGFDVDINNSGYGNLGHMESSSSRSLFGIGNRNLKEKLARRNEQARMALTAAEISEDSSFEQEARMNSVENTIMNNQIALAGGLETNLLGG